MSEKHSVRFSIEQLQLAEILGTKFRPRHTKENRKMSYYVRIKSDQCKKITETILNNPLEVVRIEKNYPEAFHNIFSRIQKGSDLDLKAVCLSRLEVALLTLLTPLIKFEVEDDDTPLIEVEVDSKDLDALVEKAELVNDTTSGILSQIIKAKLETLGLHILEFSKGDEEC